MPICLKWNFRVLRGEEGTLKNIGLFTSGGQIHNLS